MINRHLADSITATFETGTAIIAWMNVRQIVRDKRVTGFWWPSIVFNNMWGVWAFIFYSSLGMWLAVTMLSVKLVGQFSWIGLILYYKHENRTRI
jgi:hypothetical protein